MIVLIDKPKQNNDSVHRSTTKLNDLYMFTRFAIVSAFQVEDDKRSNTLSLSFISHTCSSSAVPSCAKTRICEQPCVLANATASISLNRDLHSSVVARTPSASSAATVCFRVAKEFSRTKDTTTTSAVCCMLTVVLFCSF